MQGEYSAATGGSAPGNIEALHRLHRFGGLSLVQQMASLFASEMPPRLYAARTAAAEGDRDTVRGVAHALRSSCGQIGAVRMVTICDRLLSDDLADMAAETEQLERESARFIAWLDATLVASRELQ